MQTWVAVHLEEPDTPLGIQYAIEREKRSDAALLLWNAGPGKAACMDQLSFKAGAHNSVPAIEILEMSLAGRRKDLVVHQQLLAGIQHVCLLNPLGL